MKVLWYRYRAAVFVGAELLTYRELVFTIAPIGELCASGFRSSDTAPWISQPVHGEAVG